MKSRQFRCNTTLLSDSTIFQEEALKCSDIQRYTQAFRKRKSCGTNLFCPHTMTKQSDKWKRGCWWFFYSAGSCWQKQTANTKAQKTHWSQHAVRFGICTPVVCVLCVCGKAALCVCVCPSRCFWQSRPVQEQRPRGVYCPFLSPCFCRYVLYWSSVFSIVSHHVKVEA